MPNPIRVHGRTIGDTLNICLFEGTLLEDDPSAMAPTSLPLVGSKAEETVQPKFGR